MLAYTDARTLARAIRDGLPEDMRGRLKAIHVMPKLHEGHMTVRIFMIPFTAEDPDPFIFADKEL